MMALYFLLLPAVCAAIAGTVIWVTNRGQVLDDSRLIQQFILWFAICTALAWGLTKTDAVRLRIDPQYKLQTEVDAHPVYAAVKRMSREDHAKLHNFLATQLAQGKTLTDAFLAARPLLEESIRYQLQFTDQKTFLNWANMQIETLRELQAADPLLCFRALSVKPLPSSPLLSPLLFSVENTRAFHQSVIEIYEFKDRYNSTPRTPEKGPEHNEVVREYRAIMETLTARFGAPMEKQLSAWALANAPTETEAQICAAKIFQLQAMQSRPPAMANRLLRSSNSGLVQ
jgi:hypothetical protein